MKKKNVPCWISVLLVFLAGCSGGEAIPEQVITMAAEISEEPAPQQETVGNVTEYVFSFQGVTVIPGESMPQAAADAAISATQYSSCVGAGLETLYTYEGFDITARNGGSSTQVYSIYFHSADISTPEGLSIGDGVERVETLYGEPDSQGGYAWVYNDGRTDLIILLAENAVVGIEYRTVL